MKDDFSAYSAEILLGIFRKEDNTEGDLSYDAGQCLLVRWRQGIDLEVLIDLLESELDRDRGIGAYFLREIGGRVDGLNIPVLKLADDALHDCRWSFAYFMLQSRFYNPDIAIALAKCMVDFNLVVRQEVIRWAVHATDDQFEDFSMRVETGAGAFDTFLRQPAIIDRWKKSERNRAIRGLGIARRLRDGEAVEEIRKDTPEEDSFVFDRLQFSESILKRWVERRKAQFAEC